ncbi:NUDIX hydrolase [Cognatishimia activa]|uniref:NUDIX domain protein n=1 Tax=Cognatishimia activa TaxID=1715691 RepID=A0A0P1IV25_9RHOB|nr:NUDIX hydrolase [Cognatishimia activa]CUI50038.1 NUDIX domain protein [Cognatishimia activa]CUK27370.1 NUDIX domain protein [Cognatishimia activa]
MREKIQDLISGIEPYDSLESQHIKDTLDWIKSGAELFRQHGPDIPPQHLVSYFLLVDRDWVLLVDHIKANLWLPSGGHVDPNEHPLQTVKRECREELKVDAQFIVEDPVFLTRCDTNGAMNVHTDVSLWFLLKGKRDYPYDFDRGEFRDVQWFRTDQLPLHRIDPNLERFVSKISKIGY